MGRYTEVQRVGLYQALPPQIRKKRHIDLGVIARGSRAIDDVPDLNLPKASRPPRLYRYQEPLPVHLERRQSPGMAAKPPALHQANEAIGDTRRHAMAVNIPQRAPMAKKSPAGFFVPGAPDAGDVRPHRVHDPLPRNAAPMSHRQLGPEKLQNLHRRASDGTRGK